MMISDHQPAVSNEFVFYSRERGGGASVFMSISLPFRFSFKFSYLKQHPFP